MMPVIPRTLAILVRTLFLPHSGAWKIHPLNETRRLPVLLLKFWLIMDGIYLWVC